MIWKLTTKGGREAKTTERAHASNENTTHENLFRISLMAAQGTYMRAQATYLHDFCQVAP